MFVRLRVENPFEWLKLRLVRKALHKCTPFTMGGSICIKYQLSSIKIISHFNNIENTVDRNVFWYRGHPAVAN